MRTDTYAVNLNRRQIHELSDAGGRRLVCEAGTLWITLDHDPRDIVLEPGQAFTPAQGQRALVYALAPSRVTVHGIPARAARNWAAWLQRPAVT